MRYDKKQGKKAMTLEVFTPTVNNTVGCLFRNQPTKNKTVNKRKLKINNTRFLRGPGLKTALVHESLRLI